MKNKYLRFSRLLMNKIAQKENEVKRFFVAFDVIAPWPEKEPKGRYIEKSLRHLTLAFLGNVEVAKIDKLLSNMVLPAFLIGPVGIFDKVLSLPVRHPNVVAYNISWLNDAKKIEEFRNRLNNSLKDFFSTDYHEKFLAHVTVCRAPFIIKEWKKNFSKLPFFITDMALYESLGKSEYKSVWKHGFILPFEEIEHTADIAFKVRGADYTSLYVNAFVSLCFKFPNLSDYFINISCSSIDDVIIHLNEIVCRVDIEIGSPFKAVSFGSKVKKETNYLEWEMIVDV